MPGKFEIMRAVRDGLNSLKFAEDKNDAWWSTTVKTELCRIGRKFGCKVGAKADEVDEADRDYGEWLYDVTWLEYEKGARGELVDAPLVAECEWGNKGKIESDFKKLLLARTRVRLMIFDSDRAGGSKETAERLAGKVREFNGSHAEDAWLLASWENDDWSFRYFMIDANHQAIPFPPPSGD